MRAANFDLTTIRLFLHVLSVTIWIGGQVVMMALVPVLRSAGVEGLPAKAARAFNMVAWPAMGVALFTGMWNLFAITEEKTFGWNMTFGTKFLFVLISGAAALVHARASSPKIKGITGAIGFLSALVALFLGVAL